MPDKCRAIVESSFFNRFIIGVIVLAGLIVGLETYQGLAEKYGTLFKILDVLIIAIFIAEIALKMIALAPKPLDYFKEPWNIFDFVIVAVCLIPVGGGFGPLLRLFRLLRVLKLLTAIPKLQLLVSALLKSLPSMGYVVVLLFLLFYVYGVAGVMFFGANDPIHFGSLGQSLLSLFRVVTLEDWTDVMYLQIYGSDHYAGYNFSAENLEQYTFQPKAMPVLAVIYFVSFVLIGTMIILNLVIGVVINGMEDARLEAEIDLLHAEQEKSEADDQLIMENQITLLSSQIRDLNEAVNRMGKIITSQKN